MHRAPSAPPELPGYRYVSLLGSGGFSDVFLYDQELPKRQVAVKVLLTEELTAANRAQFVAEANVMAQLSAHPYIVTIFHADVADDGRPYLVMEYCSGPSLASRYKQGPFGVEDALRTGIRLCSAIATAHAAGTLHRDIKPGNVLTNAFGWPALTDFGIASALEELPVHTTSHPRDQLDDTGTGSGASVGMSVPWSPPEMFEDDPRGDVRSDVFSLTATIHTLLAGRTPFEVPGRSNGTLDLIGRIERGTITPIGRDDLPNSLVAVLAKGMASRRSDRYAGAVELARALQRVELELGYAPTGIEVPNLVVAPESRTDAPDEDATRARDIAVIAAQEPDTRPTGQAERSGADTIGGPATSPGRRRGDADPRDDNTVVRSPVTLAAQQAQRAADAGPATDHPAETGDDSPGDDSQGETPPHHRRVLLPVAVLAAVLIAAGIVAAVLIPRNAPQPVQTMGPPGEGGVSVSAVPEPKLVSVTTASDGSSATFTWSNPKPRSGDAYLWARAESPNKVAHLDEPRVSVRFDDAASRICIDVWVLRDGRTSPNPLKACTK